MRDGKENGTVFFGVYSRSRGLGLRFMVGV